MSYIAFDLDALNVAPSVASAAGMRVGDVTHGLLQMWAWCFRHELDVITNVHLVGFFGVDAAAPLEAFGFLEAHQTGWRVKGAERYLRVKQAQRDGGRKGRAASSSTVGDTSGSTSRSTLRSTSGSTSGSAQALTPSTEHRAPNLKDIPNADASGSSDGSATTQLVLVGQKSKAKPRPAPDPKAEFERFSASLTPDEGKVFESYEKAMGVELGADWGLRKFIAQKLVAHPADELCAAIRGHLSDSWRREKASSLRAVLRDASHIATMAKLARGAA